MASDVRRNIVATSHERRVARRITARGDEGLTESLLQLNGVRAGGRYLLRQLYAVGAEGAVYDVKDMKDPNAKPLVAKVALHPYHRPFDLLPDEVRKSRYSLRVESQYLLGNVSPFMPRGVGIFETHNPALDAARGDAFAEPEPVLVMEKLPGFDLDRWLARAHRSSVPRVVLRRTLDRVAVVLLQALTDLRGRGQIFADLRPGNMRMMGRPERRVRMLDAGSLVSVHDKSGRFPHVPAYLPPELFRATQAGQLIVPNDAVQAVMAGRTLFEAATGSVPHPGQEVDLSLLAGSDVSSPVGDVIARLCTGEYSDARTALEHLYQHASRRVAHGNDPRRTPVVDTKVVPGPRVAAPGGAARAVASASHPVAKAVVPGAAAARAASATPPATQNDQILPPSKKPSGFFGRLVGKLLGR